MLIKEFYDRSSSKRGRRRLLLKCNTCFSEFEIRFCSKRVKKDYHFCSVDCTNVAARKGGILYAQKCKTTMKNYGVKNPSQSKIVKERKAATCMKNFGVRTPFQSESVKEKTKLTCLEKYGEENPFSFGGKRFLELMEEKHGVQHALSKEEFREKAKRTYLEKYGVEHALMSDEVKEKRKKTFLDKYGFEVAAKSEKVKKKIRQTCLEKYGVDSYFKTEIARSRSNTPESIRKAHETRKRNGSYGKSRAEDHLYEKLCEVFLLENIERQVIVNGWTIDFKVGEIYIQFDGVYWHGLDRPECEVMNPTTRQGEIIRSTYLRDKDQNRWFAENNLKLFRCSDVDVYDKPEQAYNKILKKLEEFNRNE